MAGITKKLINNVESCVDENIEGFLTVNQGLCLMKGHRVIMRRDINAYKQRGLVTTLTGGGSGHEPAFSGYVGPGMVCAAVQGAIFASPSPTPILAALRALGINHKAGVIMVYNNYTGDRLNFGIALERAKAEGIRVGMLINRCDCALLEGRDRSAGRRGIIGLTFLLKVVGSMAENGKDFDEIMQTGSKIIERIGTLGVCLSPCSLPGGPPMFKVAENEIEIGLGLHGEAGVKTSKMMTACDCVATMLDHMTNKSNKNRLPLKSGDHVALSLNNLGSTTELEMNILAKETIEQLEKKNIFVDRAYVNRFATSLEMAGFNITIFILDEEIKSNLDFPSKATAWVQPFLLDGQYERKPGIHIYDEGSDIVAKSASDTKTPTVTTATSDRVYKVLHSVCTSLISSEAKLNQLDLESGDGDCGTTMKTGAKAILDQLGSVSTPGLPVNQPSSLLLQLANIVEQSMGGTSGALYSLLLTSAANTFKEAADFNTIIKALDQGIQVLSKCGGAQLGDRTMLDPLHSAYLVMSQHKTSVVQTLQAAAQAAEKSAQDTTNMQASAGRASYVNPEHLTQPDAGATGVALWMRAAADAISNAY